MIVLKLLPLLSFFLSFFLSFLLFETYTRKRQCVYWNNLVKLWKKTMRSSFYLTFVFKMLSKFTSIAFFFIFCFSAFHPFPQRLLYFCANSLFLLLFCLTCFSFFFGVLFTSRPIWSISHYDVEIQPPPLLLLWPGYMPASG